MAMQSQEKTVADSDEAGRRARFGSLPERIRLEDTIEERPAVAPDPARDAYNADEWLVRTCL
ncbi:hypothetical protein [Streptomyces cylindrosporus]